jgi:hypothetical protein
MQSPSFYTLCSLSEAPRHIQIPPKQSCLQTHNLPTPNSPPNLVEKSIEPETPGDFIPRTIKVKAYKTEKGKAGNADSDADVPSMNILSDPVVAEHYFTVYELAH